MTDLLGLAGQLQLTGHSFLVSRQLLPFFVQSLINPVRIYLRHREQLNADRSLGSFGHITVNFLRCKGQNRGDQTQHSVQNMIHHRLYRAAGSSVRQLRIQGVLGNIQIQVAHLHHAEVMNGMVNRMELIGIISRTHTLDQHLQAVQHPAVNLTQLSVRQQISRQIKAVQVRKQETRSVADLAVGFAHLLQNAVADSQIRAIISRAYPQAQHIGAHFVDDLQRVNHVAQRFTHLAALFIHQKAVSQYGLVRRFAAAGHRNIQRGVKPTTVLVRAFQVQINRPAQLLTLIGHGQMAAAAVKPNVHNVGFLAELMAATFTGQALGDQLGSVLGKPDVGAMLGKQLLDVRNRFIINNFLAAFLAVENRNRYTPGTLTGDAPVAAVFHHIIDAVMAPGRDPLHIVNFLQGLLTEAVNRAEPLFGGAEDDGVFAAPTMRISVGDPL